MSSNPKVMPRLNLSDDIVCEPGRALFIREFDAVSADAADAEVRPAQNHDSVSF